jgi:hypothetical protein
MLSACPVHWTWSRLAKIEPCAVGTGGSLTATGIDLNHIQSAPGPWWSTGILLHAALGIDALAKSGQRALAKQRAEAFLKRHPKSVLTSRIQAYLED